MEAAIVVPIRCALAMLGLAACAVVMTGCSDGNVIDTEYVEGLVTLDGAPVPDATVMFVPVNEGQGMSATGMTDARGVFRLTGANVGEARVKAQAGTKPGEYHVGVIKSVSEKVMSQEEAREKGVPYVAPTPGKGPKVTHVVPEKYNDPKKSGLKATVKEGKNDIPIELSSN